MAGCPGPDSNRDALRHCPLKTACLPVSPPGRGSCPRTGRGDGNLPGRKGGVKRDVQRESSAWRLARATAAGGTALFVQVPEFTVKQAVPADQRTRDWPCADGGVHYPPVATGTRGNP